MAVVKVESNIDVLTAAKTRIKNIWDSAPKIYLAFSAGKDSLCVSNLVYELILSGEIDPKKLTVYFIDEEGLYKSMVDAAMRWRRNSWLWERSSDGTACRSSRSVRWIRSQLQNRG